MSQGMAKSIFEYLTYKNPELKHENRFKCTLSREDWWLTPKRLVPWEEFNFQTMMQMFGERLKTELMRNDRKLDYPAPKISLNAEGTVSGEDTAINILTRWTKPMVTAALEAVDDTFHPVFWVPPSLSRSPPIAAPKPQPEMVQGGEQPRRRSLRNRKGSMPTSDSKSRSRSRPPRPDGAGIHFAGLANSSVSQGNQQDSTTTRSRLACEIKPGSMWTSEALQIGHLVDENGYWLENRSNARDASPLVQVYNYCVNLDTRYGFLITSREILAVRVGPPLESRSPSSSKLSHERTEQKLNEMLYYHGVMEYAIIPWGNYRTKGKYENMTINLSLWVLCILAGQDYRPDWSYKALSEERLIVRDTPNQRESESGPGDAGDASDASDDRNRSNISDARDESGDGGDDSDASTETNTSDDNNLDDRYLLSFGPESDLPATKRSSQGRKRKRNTMASVQTRGKRRRNLDA